MNSSEEKSVFVGTRELAEMLDCSKRTVYRLIQSGKIPKPVKIGTLKRWIRSDIEKWTRDGCPRCR
jgi:excisionase family DNA binding protein